MITNKEQKCRFLWKVTAAHMVTYLFCGMFFSQVLHYETVWQSGIFGAQSGGMRDYHSGWITLGPFLQIFRGLLFGGILLLMPEEFFRQRFGWLKLWIVLAGIGIVNTPGPGLGSIEGMIYTAAPWQAHGLYSLEIMVQTLWFSWWLWEGKKTNKKINKKISTTIKTNTNIKTNIKTNTKKLKYPTIAAVIALVCFALSGIAVTLMQGADLTAKTAEPAAMPLLLITAATTFITVLLYQEKRQFPLQICLTGCYLGNGLPSTVVNLRTSFALQSLLPLLLALIPTLLVWLLLCRTSFHQVKHQE